MNRSTTRSPDPKRVAAGRANWLKRKGLTPEGRERLRQSTLKHAPWRFSTGPRTAEGKRRSSQNGRCRQKGAKSVRQLRAGLAQAAGLVTQMEELRKLVSRVCRQKEGAA